MGCVRDKTGGHIKVSSLLCAIAACAAALCHPRPGIGAEESISLRAEVPPTQRPRIGWGKDPFVPLVPTGAQAGADATAELKLTAIFFSKDNPSAIINDRIVYVGSMIRGQKIVDIGRTHVILRNNEGSVRLEFAGSPAQATGK